jgi:hypothetical protein
MEPTRPARCLGFMRYWLQAGRAAHLEAVRRPDHLRRGVPREGEALLRTGHLPAPILPSTMYSVSYIR